MSGSHSIAYAAVSDHLIRSAMEEARLTRMTLTIADTLCPGLRLVARPVEPPLWMLYCYDSDRHLEKRLLGMYPAIEISKARKKAWNLRVKTKKLARPGKSPAGVTLDQLFLLYEDCHPTSIYWGRNKAKYFKLISSFTSSSWNHTSCKKLQRYIDGHHAPLQNLQAATRAINKVVAWAEKNGIIEPTGKPLTSPKGRSLGRTRYQPPSDGAR